MRKRKPTTTMYLKLLRRVAKDVCKRWGLPQVTITELPGKTRHYGECFERTKISIRLEKHNGHYLTMGSILRTLGHELAHTAEWDVDKDHGKEWRREYRRIMFYIYRKYGK